MKDSWPIQQLELAPGSGLTTADSGTPVCKWGGTPAAPTGRLTTTPGATAGNPLFMDCGTPKGFTSANFGALVELYARDR